MLSHAVMSVVHVFPSFLMLSLACVFVRDGLPSVEMWFDCGEDWCCGLSKDEMVEMVGFHQVMWFVMLESANDWILGVDTPGQHVPPCIWYGMACLLIKYAIGCVSCLVEWGWHHTLWSVFVTFFVNYINHMVQEGLFCAGNLSTASGERLSENHSREWHTLVVDRCNGM
jgi:hypothetical protein